MTVHLLQAALNWDASIARMGFCGARLEHLWLTSNTEGLCLWEWQAACDEEGAGPCLASGQLIALFLLRTGLWTISELSGCIHAIASCSHL